jgi:3-hydroxyacyl-[acyl-carrier-protein] dehydratase
MQYYKHEFPNVEDYLHHRPPYLLVDEIISISEREIETQASFVGSEPFLAGHFPGAPVVPGALMQELTTQTAGILIAANYNPMKVYNTHDPYFNEFALGVLSRVNYGKYKRFVRPGDMLRVRAVLNENIADTFDFSASILVDQSLVMRNSFRLTNIESKVLFAG